MSYGTAENGKGWNDETLEYKRSPSIEAYLKLRRDNPESEIEIATLGGIDALFAMREELEDHGFDPNIVVQTLDADHDAICKVSLQIMQKLTDKRELESKGESHLISRGKAVPDKLVDWLICVMLDALSWNDDLEIPRDLIVLIQHRIGGLSSSYRRAIQAHDGRRNAIWIGAQFIARKQELTLKGVAHVLGVSTSTVMRWFPEDSFHEECEEQAKFFDSDGKFIGLELHKKE